MRRVLDDQQATFRPRTPAMVSGSIEVAGEVHEDDRLRSTGALRGRILQAHQRRIRRRDIDENRLRSDIEDAIRSRHEGQRGHEHLVARTDPKRVQDQMEAGRAGTHRHGIVGTVGLGERRSKALTLSPIVIQPLSMTSARAAFSSHPSVGSETSNMDDLAFSAARVAAAARTASPPSRQWTAPALPT